MNFSHDLTIFKDFDRSIRVFPVNPLFAPGACAENLSFFPRIKGVTNFKPLARESPSLHLLLLLPLWEIR